jgi:ABC-type transport system substrate-binding protein
MRARTLAALIAFLCLLGSALPPGEGAPKAGGAIKIALLRDPTGWDPHINYGATTYTFQANIYEGLLRYSLKGILEPGLARRPTSSTSGRASASTAAIRSRPTT